MITERTLRKWRKEALMDIDALINNNKMMTGVTLQQTDERILRLTQELLDQHLLRK